MGVFWPALQRATNANGTPRAGFKWCFYLSGSDTPTPVYSDSELTASLGTELTADAGGLFNSGNGAYYSDEVATRAVLKDNLGATVVDLDPVNDLAAADYVTAEDLQASLDSGQYRTTTDAPETETYFTIERLSDTAVKLKMLGEDGIVRYHTLSLEAEAADYFRRPVFIHDGTAGLDSARFASFCKLTDTTGLIAYSPRDDSKNDGEIAMRLDVVPYTLNTTTRSLSLGSVVTVFTPSGFTTGTGAMWQVQLMRLPSGRILLFAVELNSPDGTYSNAASRYDLVLFYSDDNGLTWSSKQTLLAGETAYTQFGLADYNSAAAGLEVPGGVNVAVRTSAGRIIVTGFLRNAPNHYLASIYTDDPGGITGWTVGNALVYPDANYNEPATVLLGDGTVKAFVRKSNEAARGIFELDTSTMTWAFDRKATETAIQDAPSAAIASSQRVIIGGATTTGDNRLGYSFFTSSDGGDTFGSAVTRLFGRKQRIGYTFLSRISADYWGALYEATSVQAPGSFNQKGSIGLLVFNDAALTQDLPAVAADSLTYTAATEYATYEAWVTGDGGTIGDSAKCLAAITAAINGNYYSRIGFAVSAEWGRKITGASSDKLYSIGPNQIASSSTGITTSLSIDTATISGRKLLKFPDSGAFAKFNAHELRLGSKCGFVMLDKAADTNGANGFGVRWTDSALHYVFAGGSFYSDGDFILQGSPIYACSSSDTSHFALDYDAREATHGRNGADDQTVMGWTKFSNAGATFDFTLRGEGGANRLMAECWHLNGENLTEAMIAQCGADVHGRW